MMDMADREGSETGNDEKRRRQLRRVGIEWLLVLCVQLGCPDVEAGGGGKRIGGWEDWLAVWLLLAGGLSGAGCVLCC